MILTDHFLSVEDLEGLGERIREGLPVNYPEEAVEGYIKLFEEEADRLPRFKRRVAVVILLLTLLVVVLLLAAGT